MQEDDFFEMFKTSSSKFSQCFLEGINYAYQYARKFSITPSSGCFLRVDQKYSNVWTIT